MRLLVCVVALSLSGCAGVSIASHAISAGALVSDLKVTPDRYDLNEVECPMPSGTIALRAPGDCDKPLPGVH